RSWRKIDIGGILSRHAERARVHQKIRIGKKFCNGLPAMRRRSAGKVIGKLDGARQGSVNDADVLIAICLQGMDDGTRSPARPQYGRHPALSPIRCCLIEIGGKTISVAIAAAEHAILEPQCVHSSYDRRRLIAARY